jgi:hypothetical protein
MSLRVVTSFINTNIPGAYPNVTVQSQPVGLGSSGVVVIFGEAAGGPSYQDVALINNSFTPDQLAKVQQQYISGSIVDAMSALAAPSDDPDITGSANLIYIAKTNASTKASSAFAADYGTLSDSNWGVPGNSYKYQVLAVDAEVAPTYTGSVITAFGAPLNGASFSIRLDGGAADVITLSATAGNHATIAELVTELNTMLPSGIVASASVAPVNALVLTVSPDSAAWGKGWGKSFELVDSTPGDLAALGLAAGLTESSQEPVIDVNIINTNTNVNQTLAVSADIALEVGYAGTTGTLTIASGTLTTTVTGGTGGNLSIVLSQYTTISDLALFIASQPGYSAVCPPNAQQLPPSALDAVSAIGIASTGATLLPGRIKDGASNFAKALATSVLIFAPGSAGNAGLPAPMANQVFLTGGTLGPTLAIDIINVLTQLAGINCNIIVPLFSQDATEDIAAGNTDSGSTYTIAAVNAATKNHCIQFSTPALKKNRICILSFTDDTVNTYINAKAQAQSLGNYRCSLTMQEVMQVNSQGVIETFQPWYASTLAAGMQAGGFYKAIVNKAANIVSYVDPAGFDSGSPGDVEDALSAGLLFFSQDTGRAGYWVSDQTTYGFDTNFVYNSIQAVYASDLVALDLAQSFFHQFVGQSLADVSASSGLSFLTQKMDGYLKLKLIGSSSDAPLGYKNPKIVINAPEMDVYVEIKLATAIYFIPININISQIMQSAT